MLKLEIDIGLEFRSMFRLYRLEHIDVIIVGYSRLVFFPACPSYSFLWQFLLRTSEWSHKHWKALAAGKSNPGFKGTKSSFSSTK